MPILNLVCPDSGVIPIETRVVQATELQTALINSKLRLCKAGALALTALTSKALLEAHECDFDGYPAGGLTLAAWGDPIVDGAAESVLLAAPSKQFNWAHVADDVANDVGIAFVVDAAGNLRGAVELPSPATMATVLDGLSVQFTLRV